LSQDTIYVNTRALSAALTGVQRYALEITTRLGGRVRRVAPQANARGIRGHLWEQALLPLAIGRSVLWSPANTGPLAVRRQVLTIHDLTPMDHPEWMGPAFARWYRWLWPRLIPRVHHVIADSASTKERIVHWFDVPEERVAVVHSGVDDRFRPCSEEAILAARSALGLTERRYVLSLSSLEPRKNLHRLLRAWERALPHLPDDVWLVIAGATGAQEVFGEYTLGDLPRRVRLTGRVGDAHLPALYAGALVFAYPSVYEGFGLPPLEAMASGTPVLTGNRTSLPEVVGDAGLMVDPYDVDALADGLRTLLTDDALRERLRERGVERAKDFTWARAAEQVWSLLVEAAHR
jgi:glycosyltransferase involved in cell wall biosynthesis